MVFLRGPSDSKYPQVSRTHFSILANHNNDVVWMISTYPLIFKSSSPFTNPLVTVSSTLITIGITVTFMFHSLFSFQARSRHIFFLFGSLQFYQVVTRNGKVFYSVGLFIIIIIIIIIIIESFSQSY